MRIFEVGLHHDSGVSYVYVWAPDEGMARSQVMVKERCPERSIFSCVEVSEMPCAQEMEYWR